MIRVINGIAQALANSKKNDEDNALDIILRKIKLMKAYSLFSIVITSLGSNLEAPSMLASTFIDSATDADAEPISNCCGACAGGGGDGCTEGTCDCIMGAMSWVFGT